MGKSRRGYMKMNSDLEEDMEVLHQSRRRPVEEAPEPTRAEAVEAVADVSEPEVIKDEVVETATESEVAGDEVVAGSFSDTAEVEAAEATRPEVEEPVVAKSAGGLFSRLKAALATPAAPKPEVVAPVAAKPAGGLFGRFMAGVAGAGVSDVVEDAAIDDDWRRCLRASIKGMGMPRLTD